MEQQTTTRAVFRFDAFELDVEGRQLRKHGIPLKLHGQPLEILILLLDRSPHVVSRDEMKAELWPGGTYVDFDHSLGTAINKLRDALGDSSSQSRYIETIPRYGYRFVGTLLRDDPHGEEPVPAATHEEAPPTPPALESAVGSGWWKPMLLGATLTLVIVAVALLANRPLAPQLVSITRITADDRQKLVASVPAATLISAEGRIYFTEWSGAGTTLHEISDDGGLPRRLPSPTAMARVENSCPPSQMLVLGFESSEVEAGIWMLPLPAGNPARVGSVVAHAALCSADGRQVIYASANELFTINRDGTGASRMASLPGPAYWLRWSPRQDRVRFTILDVETGATSMWEVGADGGGLRRLLPGWMAESVACCGASTLDGDYFVFHTDHSSSTAVWLRSERDWRLRLSSREVRLVGGPAEFSPAVPGADPDTLFAVGGHRRGELMRYDPVVRAFSPFLSGVSAADLDWSAAVDLVTYVSYPEAQVWRSRSDGRDRVQLTAEPLRASSPRWSPDASRIAYLAAAPGHRAVLYVAAAANGAAEPLYTLNAFDGSLSWSPGGDSIAIGAGPWQPATGIVVLDLASRQSQLLPGSEGLFDPRWSPDGRFIAARGLDPSQVLLFDVRARTWRVLVRVATGPLSWSRDGRYLLAQTLGEDPWWVRIAADTGNIERLHPLKDFRQVLNARGPWATASPDGSPVVLFDVGTEEIYRLKWRPR